MAVPFLRASTRLSRALSSAAALVRTLNLALPSRNRVWRRGTLMLLAVAVVAGFAAPSALAAPNITLDKQAPDRVLFGEDSPVTLTAANPTGQPYGYNLSFRDVLPAGVSYVPGSAPVAPLIIPNAPAAGQTTLIFENVSDLSPGSSYSLGYQVRHNTGVLGVGDSYTNQAGAYINDDPRFVPDFAANGTPAGDFTGSATDSATTRINAIEIEKDEPSPEGELLRGVHDHQTVYTLTVRNNEVEPTTGIHVEDWLPAGLEFLGCGTEDNTTDAPTNPATSPNEYAGSGPLNPGNAPAAPNCVTPDLVETVLTDPDGAGPLPTAVYTHVVWNDVGTIAPSGQIQIQYVAGIPLRQNTTTWTSTFPPSPASLDQGSNLDNNSGPETQDEQALTNYATADGDFNGTLAVDDDDTLTRTAEDLRVLKSVTPDTINQGQISTWSLRISTSEYRYVDDVRVDDTLPDGLCPLGPSNFEGGGNQTAECNPTGAQPTAAYTSVTEAADGSWTIAWDDSTVPQLARMQPSSDFTISFPTKTRALYQENFQNANPVLARDSWTNKVDIAGADFRICAPSDPDCTGGGAKIDGDEPDGVDDIDTSSASQQAGGITIDKKVREATPTPVSCATGAYVDGPAPTYGPGDTVCWQLRIDFATLLETGDPELTDFLPAGVSYVPGSATPTGNNSVTSTFSDADAANGRLTWDLGTDVDEGGLVFEWRFATVVRQGVADAAGDIEGNLMKLAFENTGGESFPLRDEVNFERSQALLDLVKGVRDINNAPAAGNGPNVDGGNVGAGDVVTFRVDVSNGGDLAAANAVVWDELQDGIICAAVSNISNGGTCSGTRITWTGIAVAAGASATRTYDVTIPNGVEPNRQFDDNAGVVSYTSATNTGGNFTYVPANNIDPAAPPANSAAADDPSWVTTRAVGMTKTRTTQVNETGNNLASQATIGERIDYTVTIVVPEGTTLYGSPVFTDNLSARQTYVTPPAAAATLNGGALPGGFTLDASGNAVSLQFPATYTNAGSSGDDTIAITFSATVDDEAANSRTSPNETLTNTAGFTWDDADGTDRSASANVSTTIVEPDMTVAKTDNDADDRITPGQTVSYALTYRNRTGTRVSTAHEVQLVDHVPPGLTPVLPIPGGGTWDPGARTITWTIASLAPNTSSNLRSYSVTVDDPATAGSVFTNTVDITATSMPGAVTGERGPVSPITAGYIAQAQRTLQLGDATLTKSVDPGTATVGEQVTYTTEITFPAGVNYFDTTMIDTLPDGMVFDETVDVTCNGGPCTPAVTALPPQPQGNGSTRLGWFLDDLPAGPARTYEITYTAHVENEAAIGDGDTLTNVAQAFYRGTSVISGVPGSIPDPSSFPNNSNPDNADVDVIEPEVALDKDVSADAGDDDVRPTQPGDSYTYSLRVTNTGTAPAYDVEVTDTPDASRLVNISVVPSPDADETDTNGSDGTLGWTIPGPIAPGASVTLTYTADLAPSAVLSDGDTVVNTADVPRFWGVPAAERGANGFDYREYTNVPADTVTLDVHLPQLAVSKTTGGAGFPESAVAQVGEPFPWRVVISNESTVATAESVDVSDVLPANWEYVDDSASFAPGGADEPAIAGQTLTWDNVGDLAPGGQIVLTFQARPTVAAVDDPGTGPGSPNVNTVEASAVDVSGASGSADGPYTDEDTAQAVLEVPELTVDKTPDGATVDAGDPAGYSITIANDGDVPAREVVVTDVLGPGQTYTAGSATATPTTGFSETSVTPGPGAGETTIEWEIAQIPAGGSVTITLPVATDPSLAADTDLVNDAAVVSREIITAVTDDGSYKTTVDSDVGIVKVAQTDPVDAGEEMDFTFTVTNNGPSDAKGVTVTDVLPANLTFVSAEAPCSGTATVTCAIGDLAEGDSVTLTLRVLIDPNETVEVSNTASVTSTTPDSNPTNNESTATKPVGVLANVVVEKDGPAASVLQGTSFDYVIRVSNTGASSAVDVTLNDPLPAGVAFENVTTDVGSCLEASGTIDCAFGTMQPGDDAQVTVRVRAVDVGTPTNTATVETPSTESTTTDNEDDAEVEVVPAADLGVTKTAPATVDAGGEIPYVLGVTNNGPSPATEVTLSDTLPSGVEFVSADAGCTHAAGVVTCAVGDLAVSETASYTVTVKAPYALGDQTLTNSVVVDGKEGDLVTTNDSAQATTTVGPSADLSIAKTAGGATAGGSANWTIVVRNDGPSTADPVKVTDTLPAGTSLQSATPSQGGCNAAGADVVCDLGALAPGGSAQISLVTSVPDGTAHQQLRNRATVSAPQPDPDPSDNAAEASTEVSERGSNLTLSKTASADRPQLGKPLSYQLVVRNVGDSAAADVRLVDTLSNAVKFKKVTTSVGTCSRKGSAVECELGTLAPGAQATVVLTVIPIAAGPLRNAASVTAGNGADLVPADNGAVADVNVTAPKARWTLAKSVSRRSVRGGDTVRFAITVRTRDRAVAGAKVCDPLPAGLVFVRARGATFRDGRACWKLGYLAPNSKHRLRVVARAERGFSVRNVRNVAVATARNAARRTDGARVRVAPAFGGANGGVTG
jgi:uncharacterized repeat protein (TIGR01451 family)/fimbrial isopeptide formation D2 family protein